MVTLVELKQNIKTEALALGFLLCGVTTPDPPESIVIFEKWLINHHQGDMKYLTREDTRQKRANPRLLMPSVQSIICLAFPYPHLRDMPMPSSNSVVIAAYAHIDDYHQTIPEKVKRLMDNVFSKNQFAVEWRCFTDSAPILEHDLAYRAGLGWIGKNSLLLNPQFGSNFLLAEVFINLPIEPDMPLTVDYCGTCQHCIEECPTQCINADRTIQADQCISYLTIEKKGIIPDTFRPTINNHLFGCDICQQVCPWNQKGNHDLPLNKETKPIFPSILDEIIESLNFNDEEFNIRFQNSPLMRIKRQGYLRNICIVLGNSQSPKALPALIQYAGNESDPILLEHAKWAIDRLNQNLS